jgi:hypothetical protein
MRNQQNITEERRDFFRVEDEVLLKVIPSSEQAARSGQPPSELQKDSGLNLVTELQRIEHDNQQLLLQVSQQSKDLEAYLKGLNKKIDLIATQVVSSHQNREGKQTVSLSEGGIAFHSQQAFAEKSIVAIQLFLLPSYVSLTLFAKVMDCNSVDNGYSISTMFVALSDTNRQILAKQIMQVQLAAKRQLSQEE